MFQSDSVGVRRCRTTRVYVIFKGDAFQSDSVGVRRCRPA
jgi:hypothetical protein